MRTWGKTIGVVGCAAFALAFTLAGCSSNNGPRRGGPGQLRQVGNGDTRVDIPADPSSADPCRAVSTSDIRSVLGANGQLSFGVADTTDKGTCRWLFLDNGTATQFAFKWPGSGAKYYTKSVFPVAVLKGDQAKAAGSEVVTGVGDFAYFDPATLTLSVAKDPDLSFAVQLATMKGSRPAAPPATQLNQLKVLANEIVATHSR